MTTLFHKLLCWLNLHELRTIMGTETPSGRRIYKLTCLHCDYGGDWHE